MSLGFPAVWDEGYWDNNVWEDVPGTTPPPDDTVYVDTGATHSIEMALTIHLEQDIAWSRPPASVIPLRNYRAVMGDYRVTGGIPVSPPTLDCAVPVLVSVDPSGVAVPSTKRKSPEEVQTLATLRWYAQSQFVSAGDTQMQWWDDSATLAWNAYGTFQPLLDETYDYQISRPHNAEVVSRSALIFDPALGSCMSASMSINPINDADDVEFFLVLWCHPLIGGQQFSALLDNGQDLQGFHDLPYVPGDSLSGRHQALHRYSDKLVLWEDDLGIPLRWAQVSGGRPVLYRVRYGMHPLVEVWGPTNLHMSYAGPAQEQAPLCADYVLGRVFNRLDLASNGGMHLFEVDYYDHALTNSDAAVVVAALNACYAITA